MKITARVSGPALRQSLFHVGGLTIPFFLVATLTAH